MYNFVDTIGYSEGALLPSESLQINGEYIENQIAGYRTLAVSGREALSPDVMSYTSGTRDGSTLQYKRYPERIITVKYQLIAASNEEFRSAYNKLGQILDVQNAQLIFNDETDKYFIGTPCTIGEVEAGRNSVIGEFEILCTDPFKYSTYEKQAVAGYSEDGEMPENSVLIDYQGTYKSFPVLRAEMYNESEVSDDGETVRTISGDGDCGYVAFFNDREKIIQLGNPAEVDGDSSAYPKSQTLVNNTYKSTSSWSSAAQSFWTTNGSLKVAEATPAVPEQKVTTTNTILKKTTGGTIIRCDTEAPVVYYTLSAYTYDRTETSVKVKITVTSCLEKVFSYFRTAAVITGFIEINSSKKYELRNTLKKANMWWNGQTEYTTTFTATISGLTASTTALTGIKFWTRREDDIGETGLIKKEDAVSLVNIPISKWVQYAPAIPAQYYLTPSSYGSGSTWHGVTMTRNIPADAKGNIGATNFTFSYVQKLISGATAQRGTFYASLLDANGNTVAGISVQKGSNGKSASLKFHVNNKVVATQTVNIDSASSPFKLERTTTITKSTRTVKFNVCGIEKKFEEPAISPIKVTQIVFKFMQYGTTKPLAYNGLWWVKFVKNNCDTWKDIPNKFSANDVVEADCKNGEIRLNGELMPALGALGNDWETFYLQPGINQIGFSYSDWLTDEGTIPTFVVKYREVFL